MAEDIVNRAKADQQRLENEAAAHLQRTHDEIETRPKPPAESSRDAVAHRSSIERSLLDLSSVMADVTKRLDEMGQELESPRFADGRPI
jgi:hypothetical protein